MIIPYGRQTVTEDDIEAVAAVLRSDWLTTGPKVPEFEEAVARHVNAAHGIAFANGTATLHGAMHVLDIGDGDEVIVPAITFAATANCVLYQGGTPVFADVDADTLLISPADVEAKITSRTKAIIAMDFGGQPCDYDALSAIATRHGIALVADACHSLGASYQQRAVGSLADLSVFSFHPVKPITTGEGGMLMTNDEKLATRARQFRNHGIDTDQRQRQQKGQWHYSMQTLGYNYRLTDIQAALGLSQLQRLSVMTARRQQIAALYDAVLPSIDGVTPLKTLPHNEHAYHLYVVKVAPRFGRDVVFGRLRDAGIGVNVHYMPVYRHPYYQARFGDLTTSCPIAEAVFPEILTLPLYPAMTDDQVTMVINAVRDALY